MKQIYDFEDPVDYFVYVACLVFRRLNSKVKLDDAYDTAQEFLLQGDELGWKLKESHVEEFADELINGRQDRGWEH